MTITQEFLRECFDYSDGKLYWRVRPRHHFKTNRSQSIFNQNYAGTESGCIAKHGDKPDRHVIKLAGRRHYRYRLIWIYHYGEIPPDKMIDHISGHTLDDDIDNLRLVTATINANNAKRRTDNRSGVTGVSYNKRMRKWRARATDNGKDIILYLGDDFDAAVAARCHWENRHPHMTYRHGK